MEDGCANEEAAKLIDPTMFDVIVVGTGLPQSILAAAAASSGRKVLHLDADDYYGSQWASLTLEQLSSDQQNGYVVSPNDPELEQLGFTGIDCHFDKPTSCVQEICNLDGTELGPSRKYSLDTTGPKLALCAGSLVDLLLKSGGTNYLEFKSIESIYVWVDGRFVMAPATRAELFQSNLDSFDKRRLMRFLKSVQEYISSGNSGFSETDLQLPFNELLEKQQFSLPIRSMILYAIAFLEEDQTETSTLSAAEGLQALALHISSIGRFLNSGAFLYPLYGQGELPQAFCRIAAVKGALYVLRRSVDSIIVDKETGEYKGIRTCGQLLYSEKLVIGAPFHFSLKQLRQKSSANPEEEHSLPSSSTSSKSDLELGRYVCIADGSLHSSKSNILLIIPPKALRGKNPRVVRILQLGSSASVCPEDKFITQMSTVCSKGEAKGILHEVIDLLYDVRSNVTSPVDNESIKPKLLWTAFYSTELGHADSQVIDAKVGICASPDHSLDYSSMVASSEKMFRQLFDDEKWFDEERDDADADV